MEQKTTKVELRLTPQEKLAWQAEADAAGVTLSGLIRSRMDGGAPTRRVPTGAQSYSELQATIAEIEADAALTASIDLDAPELQSLRGWLSLEDSDGDVDPELLAEWNAYADGHGITLDDLLERVVIYANAAVLA